MSPDSSLPRLLRIVFVEDNPVDALTLKIALQQAGIAFDLDVITHGDQGMALARGEPPFRGEPPDLILLDLNIPGSDGKEVLSALRASRTFQNVRIGILTSSDVPRDWVDCRRAGADFYLHKPMTLDDLQSIGQVISALAVSPARSPQD
ncbi:MAG TPA: response regulator [Candidatus Polarisedimenticolia bacterium]|nr:response regulator [Candidatus Polarisedimenticolia bacterium]